MFELTPFDRRRHRMQAYNPFRELEDMERHFLKDFSLSEFKTDIQDQGNAYILEADLPGFEKQDIKIDIDDHYLTISAERHSESEEKDKKGNYLRCERSYGSFSRSFDVSTVKTDQIKAAYKNGVLKLTLPKKENAGPARKQIEIE